LQTALSVGSSCGHGTIYRRLLELFKTIDTNLDGLMQWNEFEQAALAGWL
jgi:hypothetical protein